MAETVYADQASVDAVGPWTRGERLLLAVLSGVIFLDALDSSLTQVALPSIGSDLHLGEAQLQWIVSAYVLGYGGFLLLGGRCADLFGRKRVLLCGLVALVVASAAGAVSSDSTLLIGARFVKGVSAGFTAPAALSILTNSFGEGPHRNRAMGMYTAAAAGGFSFGLVMGGLLTELSWRYTFAAVVPCGLLLLIAVLRGVSADTARPAGEPGRLDVAGAALVTGAALLLVWGVVQAPTAGLTSARTLAALAAAATLLAAFVLTELRARQPLMRLTLLRAPDLLGANVGALLLFGSATVFNVLTTLYEQDVLHWTPLRAGLVFLVAGAATGLLAPLMGGLVTRIGAHRVLLMGALSSLAAYSIWLLNGPSSSYVVIVTSLALQGAGFALAYPALNIHALAGIADHEQGVASGLIGTFFQVGGAILLAVSTAVTLASTPPHVSGSHNVHALHAGMWVAIAATAALALIPGGKLLASGASASSSHTPDDRLSDRM